MFFLNFKSQDKTNNSDWKLTPKKQVALSAYNYKLNLYFLYPRLRPLQQSSINWRPENGAKGLVGLFRERGGASCCLAPTLNVMDRECAQHPTSNIREQRERPHRLFLGRGGERPHVTPSIWRNSCVSRFQIVWMWTLLRGIWNCQDLRRKPQIGVVQVDCKPLTLQSPHQPRLKISTVD